MAHILEISRDLWKYWYIYFVFIFRVQLTQATYEF
jgi:hypothetical protein